MSNIQTELNNISTECDNIENTLTSLSDNTNLKNNLKERVKAVEDRISIAEQKIVVNPVPILYLTGDMSPMTKDTSVNLTAKLNNIYGETIFSGIATTKWQGAGSLAYPKKNFSIKLKTSSGSKFPMQFGNWYSTNEYHLKANYADYSMVRNVVGAKLYREIDETVYPNNAFGMIDGFPIVVYYENHFYGCYTWNLKQDDKLFGMNTSNNGLTQMVYRSGLGEWNIDNFEYRSDGNESASNKQTLQALLDWCKNSSYTQFSNELEEHFDKNNLITYWVFCNIMCATDNTINNWTIGTWDAKKWYVMAYDLDIIIGSLRNSSNWMHPSKPTTNLLVQQYTKVNPIWEKLEYCFRDDIIAKYNEIKEHYTPQVIASYFKNYKNLWGDTYLTKEYTRWSGRPDSTDDVDMMEDWLTKRYHYLDIIYS